MLTTIVQRPKDFLLRSLLVIALLLSFIATPIAHTHASECEGSQAGNSCSG